MSTTFIVWSRTSYSSLLRLFGAVLHSPECGSYDNGGPADKPRGLVLGDLEADRSAKPWYFMGLASRPILVVCAMGF